MLEALFYIVIGPTLLFAVAAAVLSLSTTTKDESDDVLD